MIKRSEEGERKRNLIFKLHIKIVKDEKHDYYGTLSLHDDDNDDPGRILSLVKLFPSFASLHR